MAREIKFRAMKRTKIADGLWVPEDFEKDHNYYTSEDGDTKYTGVTTVLNAAINKPALVGWAARMAVEYIRTYAHAVEGLFHVSEQHLKDAQKAHAQKRDGAADEGTRIHSLVEEYVNMRLGKVIVELPDEHFQEIKNFVDWSWRENIEFVASEKRLFSRVMFVAGTADLVFKKDGKLYIGDIKHKDKLWSREPMFQCAAYGLMWEEMYGEKPHGYCVIKTKGKFDPVWSYDVVGDTDAFKACLTIYRALSNWTV